MSEFKGCRVQCPGATCQFVRYSKIKDFSWLQLVSVFGLTVPCFNFRCQSSRVVVPVCVLLQEQGLLLAPAGERVLSDSSCLTPRRHLSVCALLQEQGLLLAPAGECV